MPIGTSFRSVASGGRASFDKTARRAEIDNNNSRTDEAAPREDAAPKTGEGCTILLIDEMPLVREGLADLLKVHFSDLFLYSADGRTLQDIELENRPDLIIINARHEEVGGDWLRSQRDSLPAICSEVPILLLSERETKSEGARAIEEGYVGFLPATQSAKQLVAAIRVILAGGQFYLCLN